MTGESLVKLPTGLGPWHFPTLGICRSALTATTVGHISSLISIWSRGTSPATRSRQVLATVTLAPYYATEKAWLR